MASVYSPRARRGAPVSTPLRWEELNGPIDPQAFTIRTIFKRRERVGDLFDPMSKDRQDIGPFCEALRVVFCETSMRRTMGKQYATRQEYSISP